MDLAACLPPASRRLVEDFTVHIEKSQAEVERTLDGALPIRPGWDPRLRDDSRLRRDFPLCLVRLGLGGFQSDVKGDIGMVFVRKKGNAAHNLPPHNRYVPRGTVELTNALVVSKALGSTAG